MGDEAKPLPGNYVSCNSYDVFITVLFTFSYFFDYITIIMMDEDHYAFSSAFCPQTHPVFSH
jgi:hypothetical protein